MNSLYNLILNAYHKSLKKEDAFRYKKMYNIYPFLLCKVGLGIDISYAYFVCRPVIYVSR